jgi:Flp pilus assembly protein TadB
MNEDTESDHDEATDEESTVSEAVRESDHDRGDDRNATLDDVEALREDVVAFADEVEGRIVKRDTLESDLKGYVRKRQRRGHARGWGPYLVLLYGTAMTIGAFAYLSGGWAVLAMLVVWLSTLGLYVLMVLVGLAGAALGVPGRLTDRVRDFRS